LNSASDMPEDFLMIVRVTRLRSNRNGVAVDAGR
jgi:hypothetical protein